MNGHSSVRTIHAVDVKKMFPIGVVNTQSIDLIAHGFYSATSMRLFLLNRKTTSFVEGERISNISKGTVNDPAVRHSKIRHIGYSALRRDAKLHQAVPLGSLQ